MIDIYTNGSQVGLSIHGLGGLLLLSYFVLDVISLFATKSLIIHKILIWLRLRREVKKLIPNWWRVDTINILTIERCHYQRGNKFLVGYRVYVKIKTKIIKSNPSTLDWTNDWIIVDRLGRIKHQKLIENIKWYDDRNVDKIKRWKRDNRLNDLGI
jgi:hypothetical protein